MITDFSQETKPITPERLMELISWCESLCDFVAMQNVDILQKDDHISNVREIQNYLSHSVPIAAIDKSIEAAENMVKTTGAMRDSIHTYHNVLAGSVAPYKYIQEFVG